MATKLKLRVNGVVHRVSASRETPLLYVLRNELSLIGPRFGCGLAQCGACSVLLDGKELRSCVTPVASVTGKSITTIEGLPALWARQRGRAAAAQELHPLQQAWIDVGVPQCGYCQNGMLIQAADLLSTSKNPTNFGANPTRTVTWTLNDGNASNATTTATTTVGITAINDPPTLSAVPSSLNIFRHIPVTLSPSLTVADPDNINLSNATVAITGRDKARLASAALQLDAGERLVTIQERLFGARLLRGTVGLGGVKCDLTVGRRKELLIHLERLEGEFDALIKLLIDSGTFTDRVDDTGVLGRQVAQDLGIVGMAARASGLDLDLRRDQPHDAYAALRFQVPVEEGGDVRARLMLRAREVEQSLSILEQALEGLPEGSVLAALPDSLPPSSSALGWAEAWRGECLHWIQTDVRGQITRAKITDPSFKNWPGLAEAVPGNILPDFPVINKSFNLSYSGNDR